MKKCLSSVILIVVSLLVWLTACIGVIWFCNSDLNSKIVKSLGGGVDISNGINLGVALGTIALAIIAWKVYRYATKQYANQKKIDYGIESAKNISGRLFFHQCALNTTQGCINNIIQQRNIVVRSGFGDITIVEKLQAESIKMRKLIDDFTSDWQLLIGPELQLLGVISNKAELLAATGIINVSIENVKLVLNNIDTAAIEEYELIEITNPISKMHKVVMDTMNLLLNPV